MDKCEEDFIPVVTGVDEQGEFEVMCEIERNFEGGIYRTQYGRGNQSEEMKNNEKIQKAYRKGLEESQKREAELRQYLGKLIKDFMDSRSSMLFQLEGELLKLSIDIAERILKKEINTNIEECLKRQVKDCIKSLNREVPVLLRLNPLDVEIIGEIIQDDDGIRDQLDRIKIIEDKRVERGGCALETEKGMLRAEILKSSARVSEALEREYGRSITESMESSQKDS
jgi:flagellar assembly protein FliH